MVESAIFFLIGFLAAALLAISAAPAVSRRAMRLATARARLQSPLSESQARAERDALRGQHAVEIVRLQRRMDAVETDRSLGKAEIGRQASRIVELETLSADQAAEIGRQRTEISNLSAEGRDLRSQAGAQEIALHDLTHQRDGAIQEFARARARITEMETIIDENRALVATLETRVAGLSVELSDLSRSSDLAAATAESERQRLFRSLSEKELDVARLTEELGVIRLRATALQAEHEAQLLETLRLQDRVEGLEARLAASESARERATLEISRQLAHIAERDSALQRAESNLADLAKRMQASESDGKAREAALAKRAQSSATANAASEGALGAERAARIELQKELDHVRARLAEANAAVHSATKGDQALRLSIARLGREMVRPHEAGEMDPLRAAQVVNFARRESVPPLGQLADPNVAAAVHEDQPAASGG